MRTNHSDGVRKSAKQGKRERQEIIDQFCDTSSVIATATAKKKILNYV